MGMVERDKIPSLCVATVAGVDCSKLCMSMHMHDVLIISSIVIAYGIPLGDLLPLTLVNHQY